MRDGDRVGAVRITRSAGPVDARIRRDRIAVGAIAVAALALGLALAWLLASSLARPLRSLARTAHRLGDGDLDARAEVGGAERAAGGGHAPSTTWPDGSSGCSRRSASSSRTRRTSSARRSPASASGSRRPRSKADDPELARELAAAEHETERLAKLLTGLLALAREGAPQRSARPVDLAAAAERPATAGAAEAEAAAAASSSRPARVTLASEDDVAVALDNLIENALLYSPPGTTVTVEARADGGRVPWRSPTRARGSRRARTERVFERFAPRRGRPRRARDRPRARDRAHARAALGRDARIASRGRAAARAPSCPPGRVGRVDPEREPVVA